MNGEHSIEASLEQRLFLGLRFSAGLLDRLAAVSSELQPRFPGGRWHPADKLHLTLRYFGQVSESTRQDILEQASLLARGLSPVPLRLDHLGFFGTPARPRVLWLAPRQPSEQLLELAAALRKRFPELEERPFAPHVTLARFRARLSKEHRDACQPSLLELKRGRERRELPAWARFGPFDEQLEQLTLFASCSTAEGVRYLSVAGFPLGDSPVTSCAGTGRVHC